MLAARLAAGVALATISDSDRAGIADRDGISSSRSVAVRFPASATRVAVGLGSLFTCHLR